MSVNNRFAMVGVRISPVRQQLSDCESLKRIGLYHKANIIRIMSISNNRSSKFRDFTVYIMYRAKGLMCMCIRAVWLQHRFCSLTSYTKHRHDRSI